MRISILIKIVLTASAFGLGFGYCAGSKTAPPTHSDHQGARAYRYFLDGDLPAAIDTYKRAYASARRDDNGRSAARYLSNIGRAFYEMGAGSADSAVNYYLLAYNEFTMFGDSLSASGTAAFLAICFASAGDGKQARQWLSVASPYYSQKKGVAHYLAVVTGMVDYRLSSTINNESAIDAALAYYKKKKDHHTLSTIYVLKADIEISKGNRAAASSYLNDALSSIGKSRERYKSSGVLLKLSAISLCAGDANAAKHYYERAVDCAPRGAGVPAFDEMSARYERLCR